MSPKSPSRVPFHRRLHVRLAGWIAIATIAIFFVNEYVNEAVFDFFELPTEMTVGDEESMLLTGASNPKAGRWVPTEEAIELTSDAMRELGVGFLWLDMQDEVVCASPGLPWSSGDRWPHENAGLLSVRLADGTRAPASISRVLHEGEDAGRLVSICLDESVHALSHGTTAGELSEVEDCMFFVPLDVVYTDAEFERTFRVERMYAMGVSFFASFCIVLLSAFLISAWITRRLSRLSESAALPVFEDSELPGPFEVEGRDEIARLATTMNAMRSRIGSLIGDLAERDEKRREWIAQVSHDLRTPLTALLACLDRADRELAKPDADTLKRITDLIAVARMDTERVSQLAEDLLTIARLDAEELRLEPVPPGELARQASRSLEVRARSRGIDLATELEPGLPTLQADGRRLMRALENLLANAIRHARQSVRIDVTSSTGSVRFSVVDDGDGFPGGPGVVALDAVKSARNDSAGLGLVVTQRAAEAHGGAFGATNREGGGADVWFTIPTRVESVR